MIITVTPIVEGVAVVGRSTTITVSTGTVGPTGATGATGSAGAQGDPGEGVPTGGTTGQALVKASGTDFDTEWSDAAGGGAVDSVNGQTGVVVLDADDLADGTTNHVFTAADDTKLAGIATGATANDTDANLKARGNHTGVQAISTVTGLQTALDGKETAGAAAAAQAASQPVDSDLTAIAALTTTSFGRGLLASADAAALRTSAGLGTASTVNTGTSSGDLPLLSTGGRLPIARIASGTPDGTKFVRDDGTLAVPAGGGGSSVGSTLYLFNNYS